MDNPKAVPPGVDLERPSVARVYDFYLGGHANWAIDREFGGQVLRRFPLLRPIARANRGFLHRAVRYLVQQGVRQFIDIGSGVPTVIPTHLAAADLARDVKVVYIDNEPVAVAHSQLLLDAYPEGTCPHAVINADLRDPNTLWSRVAETRVLDLTQPVAVLLVAVLHVHQPGPDGHDLGREAVARLRQLMPPNSYLVISHITTDEVPDDVGANLGELKTMYDNSSSSNAHWRRRPEIQDLFGDFHMVEPGLTWTTLWRPPLSHPDFVEPVFASPPESAVLAGVGRKRGRDSE